MLNRHELEPDEHGIGCARCPLPPRHRVHTTPRELPRARPVVHADQASTSIAAAMTVDWSNLTTVKANVYRAIKAAGAAGLTDDELMATEHLRDANPNTVRPRRIDLVGMGWIEAARDDSGNEVTRITRGGAPAQVWVATLQEGAK